MHMTFLHKYENYHSDDARQSPLLCIIWRHRYYSYNISGNVLGTRNTTKDKTELPFSVISAN